MLNYEIIYIATNVIFTFAIYKLFHTFFNENISNRTIEKLSYLLFFVSSSVLVLITKIPLIILFFTVSFLFMISFNYKSSIQKKIIVSSLIYSILFVIEIIVLASIGFIGISAVTDSTFNSAVGLILIRTITVIVAYLLNRFKSFKKKDYPISPIYYVAFIIILFGTLYLFVTSLENNNLTIYSVLVRGTILIVVNVTMIIIDEKLYHSIIAISEKNVLEQQNFAYENQSQIINQSTEFIKSLKHDMNNHFIILYEMFKKNQKEEIETYFEKIFSEIDGGEFSQSNNFVIDSIINFKLRRLQDVDVKINVDVSVPQTINILPYDITIILGNMLDNAITAVLKAKNKKLDLQLRCNMGNLFILLDNSYDGKLIMENGNYKSTKTDQFNHGIGLYNIEKSLEDYGGEMRIVYSPDIFSTSVIIPFQN